MSYKYRGIFERDGNNHSMMRENNSKEYSHRGRAILNAEQDAINRMVVINNLIILCVLQFQYN